MISPRALLVQGTWGWGHSNDRQWWQAGSDFALFLNRWDIGLIGGARPFIWSTSVDGIGWLFKRPTVKHLTWQNAGYCLEQYIRPPLLAAFDDYIPLAERNLVGHSHALQVIAYACAGGLKINRLITLGSPIREDMADVYKAARPNIGAWLHVHSDGSDRIQWFGELFDGHLGIVRAAPLADRNVRIDKVSHSKLLNDAGEFYLWQTKGLLDFLGGGPVNAA